MTTADGPARASFLDRWCGWVLVFAAALTPLLAWLGPLGFAPLMSLVGLAALPALRVERADQPQAAAIAVAAVWAAVSMIWSPYEPEALWNSTAAKLLAQAVLYWAAWRAALRAPVAAVRTAMIVLVWGAAILSAVLIAEGVMGARIYQAVRQAIGDPIRPDLALRNVARGVFVLAVLWGPLALAAVRLGLWRLPVLGAAAVIAGAAGLAADAPILALALAALAAGALWRWPRIAPRGLAAGAAAFFLAAPAIVWALRASGVYGRIQEAISLSWSMRMDYWSHAVDWIGDRPLRGWGLDASRMFGPGIQLHPHDAALQIWLELGAVGALAAAVFWCGVFLRLQRPYPDLAAAAGAAAGVAYLVFAAVSFGVWQEWWLALGALAAVWAGAAGRLPPAPWEIALSQRQGKASTFAHISE